MEQKKIDRIVEVDLAADLLADTVLGAALNSAALQGLQGGANGFLLLVVVEVLLLLRSQRVSIGVFPLTPSSGCVTVVSNRGECGVLAMASSEANCAAITRFFLLNAVSSSAKTSGEPS